MEYYNEPILPDTFKGGGGGCHVCRLRIPHADGYGSSTSQIFYPVTCPQRKEPGRIVQKTNDRGSFPLYTFQPLPEQILGVTTPWMHEALSLLN